MEHVPDAEPSSNWREITELSFSGPRFHDHAIEIDVVRELPAFQEIITSLAAEIWRERHPERERLPKGFVQSTQLRFRTIRSGSTMIPIEAVADAGPLLGGEVVPIVLEAIGIVWDSIKSQQDGRDLPASLPRATVLPALARWGSSLRPDETISLREPGDGSNRAQATFSHETRVRLRVYLDSYYEDTLTVYGYVRAVDRDENAAIVRMPNATRLRVIYDPRLEKAFVRALQTAGSVAVTGLARISSEDGILQRMSPATDIAPTPDAAAALPLDWLETAASAIDWSPVPTDLARNADAHLYGRRP